MNGSLTPEAVLRDILHGTEEVVRALDMKTEIAMLCYVLSVEVAIVLGALEHLRAAQPLISIALFVMFIVALISYMIVIVPAHSPRVGKGRTPDAEGAASPGVYFLTDPRRTTAQDLVRAVTQADHANELANEVLKLSTIRDTKRKRFLCAIYLTLAFSILLLIARFAG